MSAKYSPTMNNAKHHARHTNDKPWCHDTPWCHAMPCHIMLCHTTSCHATLCHATSCHATPCHAIPCNATSYLGMPHHTTSCHATPHHAMPCHTMLLKLSIKLKSAWAAKCGLTFQTREVQQGIHRNLSTNPYMSPYVETASCGEFFLTKILQKSSQGPTKVLFFIKTSKWEKWWWGWLRMTNAFILCNLLWKVQKSLAVNREGRFNKPYNQSNYPDMFTVVNA